jgi:hypothetical protein
MRDMQSSIERLMQDRPIESLRRQSGLMAELGSEDGDLKLDWVEGVGRLLENDAWLEEVEAEAAEIIQRGIRHVIWSGMGGSVMTVRVMQDVRLFGNGHAGPAIHPLDSTDPAAVNDILRRLSEYKGVALDGGELDAQDLELLLGDVLMIGVSMGMTSEEPITHLEWFLGLLARAGLPADRHCLVMTLPGSYLERFAEERGLPSRPLQLDGGTGTGGRMSAPTTRVFLLPAALAMSRSGIKKASLRDILRRAWQEHDLDHAGQSDRHPFVRLAAAMADAAEDGACRVLLALPGSWNALFPWIEQLMEESLGKGGEGIVVFREQGADPEALCFQPKGTLTVVVAAERVRDERRGFVLSQPYLSAGNKEDLLAGIAASFLGWQLAMALYGYLQRIHFAGQPAVEEYKDRARALRTGDPLAPVAAWEHLVSDGRLTLLLPSAPTTSPTSPADAFADALYGHCPTYFDLTINGELPPEAWNALESSIEQLGNITLGVPVKLRRAPAAYHSTEQSEMDGPLGLVSLRVVARTHERPLLGDYPATFLLAQAVGTWQAMVEGGRSCFLLLIDGSLEDGISLLAGFLETVDRRLRERHAQAEAT